MVANHHYTRVDMLELKDLIYRKIGHHRAEKYFDQLKRLFSSKISKAEFDKTCIRTIGQENISLHNRLIRSILQNTHLSKVPPPKAGKSIAVKALNSLQSPYGDPSISQSLRKCRSRVNRKLKRVQKQQSPTELCSLGSRPPLEVTSVEDGEEVEQLAGSPGIQSKSPVIAPLGICAKRGSFHRPLQHGFGGKIYNPETCQRSCGLPDTSSLWSRLEKKLESDGFKVSDDCVNLVNNAVDAYLKKLIEPCVQMALSRRTGGKCTEREKQLGDVRVVDLHAAMQLNPLILGKDWSTQLEKISTLCFEEQTAVEL